MTWKYCVFEGQGFAWTGRWGYLDLLVLEWRELHFRVFYKSYFIPCALPNLSSLSAIYMCVSFWLHLYLDITDLLFEHWCRKSPCCHCWLLIFLLGQSENRRKNPPTVYANPCRIVCRKYKYIKNKRSTFFLLFLFFLYGLSLSLSVFSEEFIWALVFIYYKLINSLV